MPSLPGLLDAPSATLAALGVHLDGLDAAARVIECRALSARQLARLYEIADGAEPIVAADLLAGAADGETVRFAGKNSLIAFTHFEKHFARHEGAVVGINVQSMSFATGPGYFTCADGAGGKPNELLFDYTKVPSTAPRGWPTPKSNARGVSRLVYKDMHDYNRRVARDVVIGCATRLGKPMGQYYVLARAA